MVRQNSGAGCREPLYTSTAGSGRTAGRDGQGTGRLRLMARKTPFNSVRAEQEDWQAMHTQAPHCPTLYRRIRRLEKQRKTLFETSLCGGRPPHDVCMDLAQASPVMLSQGQDRVRM